MLSNPYKAWLNKTKSDAQPLNPTAVVSLNFMLGIETTVDNSGLARWESTDRTFGVLRTHTDGSFSVFVGRYRVDPAGIEELTSVIKIPRKDFVGVMTTIMRTYFPEN